MHTFAKCIDTFAKVCILFIKVSILKGMYAYFLNVCILSECIDTFAKVCILSFNEHFQRAVPSNPEVVQAKVGTECVYAASSLTSPLRPTRSRDWGEMRWGCNSTSVQVGHFDVSSRATSSKMTFVTLRQQKYLGLFLFFFFRKWTRRWRENGSDGTWVPRVSVDAGETSHDTRWGLEWSEEEVHDLW